MKNRVLETVIGYEKAVSAIASWVASWNDSNGAGRMIIDANKLESHDQEGSGEFYTAVCTNLNAAQSCADEIYEIQTCW